MTNFEKRAKERIIYKQTIVFRTEETIMESALDPLNISMSGVYIVTNHPSTPGTKCSIEIKQYDKNNTLFVLLIEGVVTRIDDRGQGIEFKNLDEENTAQLNQLLYPDDN